MQTKTFGDKKITIRKINKSDRNRLKDFLEHINLLVGETAMLLINKKQTLKDERVFIERTLKEASQKKAVRLIAEHEEKIIGVTDIKLNPYARNHIGNFGISIRQGYRGIGLGNYLMSEIIKLAKKELKPRPKIIQLEVYVINKPAIALYKKMGFKIVAKIPKQIQYKGKLIDEFVMQKYL